VKDDNEDDGTEAFTSFVIPSPVLYHFSTLLFVFLSLSGFKQRDQKMKEKYRRSRSLEAAGRQKGTESPRLLPYSQFITPCQSHSLTLKMRVTVLE